MNHLEMSIMKSLISESCCIDIRNAGVFRFPSDFRFDLHNHKEIEINFINSGHCVMEVGKEYLPLKQGDCICISGGIPHNFIVDKKGNCSITQLEFSIDIPGGLCKELKFLEQRKAYYKFSECENVRYLMENVCRLFRSIKPEHEKETQIHLGLFQLFIELSYQISEMTKKVAKGKASKINDIVQYISENYSIDLCMEEISKRFHVSSRYIRKCFVQELGMTCQQYIVALRINKAKQLLWFTEDAVTEIALKSGFNSSQYFSRVFQQYMKMTPLEYRNLWKGTRAKESCVIENEE